MSLEGRLRRIEQSRLSLSQKIYIFKVGNSDSCQFQSEDEYQQEIKKPKYENSIIIRDLDEWI